MRECETVKGIIASGSVIGERIAMSSAGLSRSKRGGERVLRMAKGESTQRSQLDAEHLTAHLRACGHRAVDPRAGEGGGDLAGRGWLGPLQTVRGNHAIADAGTR